MSILNSFAQRIARLQETLEQKEIKPIEVLSVPDRFEEFCSSITMRSGGKMRQFIPYRYQVLLADVIARHSNVTVVKTRQLGTTQILVALFLHEGSKNPAFAASCFMRNDKDAEALTSRIRWLATQSNIELTKDEATLIRLINGAEIRSHNSSKEGNRSADSLMYLLFDEAAFQDKIGNIYAASVGSTILTGDDAKVIVVSTPSAKSGWFWDRLVENNGNRDIETICKQVGNCELYSDDLPGFYWFTDETGGAKVFIHWKCHPVYKHWPDFVERMAKRLNLDMCDADREFNLVFSDKAIEVFSAESVADAETSNRQPNANIRSCAIGLYTSKTHNAAVCFVDGVVISCKSERNPSANTAIALVGAVSSGYSVASIVLKRANGGEEVAKRLRAIYKSARVLDVTNSDIQNAVASLSLLLESRAIRIPKYENPLRDAPIAKHLRDFRRQDNKLGSLQEDKRDDCAFALALAVMASESSAKSLPIGSR